MPTAARCCTSHTQTVDVRLEDFDYPLPPEAIAQQPLPVRSDSRMLHLDRGGERLDDRHVRALPACLAPGDLLVLNDTRVLAARLFGRKNTGGAVEIFLERILDSRRLSAKLRASKTPRAGGRLYVGEFALQVESRNDELFILHCDRDISDLLDAHGHVPLPPYIQRPDAETDVERYQTVWARHAGAVAAPTAGLHFDQSLLDALRQRGVATAQVTLHVGSGTYQRVRQSDIEQHRLHHERLIVGDSLCRAIHETRQRGGRVVAVGTTVVRSLETAARHAATGEIEPYAGETDLFIRPGFDFRVVDAMVTNFHEPQSTLLMLVSAFAGRQRVLDAYAHALRQGYRFLSYGDAMLLT